MKARNGREIPNPGASRETDLWLIAHGYETGWWNDRFEPAPWPEDFFDPNSGWTCGDPRIDAQHNGATPEQPDHNPDNPPF